MINENEEHIVIRLPSATIATSQNKIEEQRNIRLKDMTSYVNIILN